MHIMEALKYHSEWGYCVKSVVQDSKVQNWSKKPQPVSIASFQTAESEKINYY